MMAEPKRVGSEFAGRGKQPLLYAAAFFLPFFILVIACVLMKVTPFGENSFAISDGSFYLNGLVKNNRMLRGEDSFFYSFQNGMGNNMWSVLAWGGLQPVAMLFSWFARPENTPYVMTWIVVVNLSLAGLCAYPLFSWRRGNKANNLIFSTSYALIGFSVVNCYHSLFFVGVQALPLVVLGLMKLLKGQSPLLYIVSLALGIFLNFYFGYMLCVASVLLFAAYSYVHWDTLKGKRGSVFLRYSLSSLLAGLLASPMWLTAVKAYSGGGRIDQTTAEEFQFVENMPFIQMFSKLFSGANSTQEIVNGLPNIFCGILTVALVILYFTDRCVEKRKKRAAGALLAFYLLSFYLKPITMAMHGFSHTNWFPYRYSFIFSFLLIGIAAEEMNRLPYRSFSDLKRCFLILLGGTVLVFGTSYEFISGGNVLLDLALLLLMGLCFWCWVNRRLHISRQVLTLILTALVSVNLFSNFVFSVRKMLVDGWEIDLSVYNNNVIATGAPVQALRTWDKGFYRMERDEQDSGTAAMDAYLYNYNGVSFSGPAVRRFVNTELCRLGLTLYSMNHLYFHGVPAAADALLGLKYVLSGEDYAAEKGFEQKAEMGRNSIYLNPNALDYAVLCDGLDTSLTLSDNAFDNLNAVWKQMSGGSRDIYTPVEDISFTLHNMTSDQTVTSKELIVLSGAETGPKEETGRVDFTFPVIRDGTVYRYDTAIVGNGFGSKYSASRICGVYEAGDTAEGVIDIHGGIVTGDQFRQYCAGLVFAYEDRDVLSEYAAELNSRPITFNYVKDTQVTGEFTAKAGQRILFTIPWDEGWKCTIDGEKVPIDKTWGLFMSVEAPEGTHTYEMKFFPAWLDYSLYISAASFAALVVFMVIWKKSKKKDREQLSALCRGN